MTIGTGSKDTGVSASEIALQIESPFGSGDLAIAGSVFLPDEGAPPSSFLIALPGGGYTREYWHPSNLDASYSFATAMIARGFGVITLDTIGTGDSDRPDDGDAITIETAAIAADRAVGIVRERLAAGTLVQGMRSVEDVRLIGVGHSLGAAIVVAQEGRTAPYDAIALLGYTNFSISTAYQPHEHEGDLTPAERREWASQHVPAAQFGAPWEHIPVFIRSDRASSRGYFHFPDVPEEVIAAEESRTIAVIPRTMLLEAMIPSVNAPFAERIACPVLLAFGEIDLSPDPSAEPATYPNCPDFTLLRVPGSAHSHNYSTPRAQLWGRLASWAQSVV